MSSHNRSRRVLASIIVLAMLTSLPVAGRAQTGLPQAWERAVDAGWQTGGAEGTDAGRDPQDTTPLFFGWQSSLAGNSGASSARGQESAPGNSLRAAPVNVREPAGAEPQDEQRLIRLDTLSESPFIESSSRKWRWILVGAGLAGIALAVILAGSSNNATGGVPPATSLPVTTLTAAPNPEPASVSPPSAPSSPSPAPAPAPAPAPEPEAPAPSSPPQSPPGQDKKDDDDDDDDDDNGNRGGSRSIRLPILFEGTIEL